jgi:hypothetical protein
VEFKSRRTFHGKDSSRETFEAFKKWLESFGRERKVFVSDNPAYDWAPINFYFHCYFGENPYSARRIGDFYAGLVGDFGRASEWKRLRITEHDHHPVHDRQHRSVEVALDLGGLSVLGLPSTRKHSSRSRRFMRATTLLFWARWLTRVHYGR